ncbi:MULTISPECIES: linalool dehydratase/isomerase domain-containing protein [unclassified Sphingomonas]|uniref:linalool dehydratase/isomerase domain-containing protein n=1 Tax=unclassified Sphingomonas TaxID=196159 RepID=UPI000A552CBD|nr:MULTISPECIES: hypothetical protein [unclassified Sphingomonas]
MIAAAKPTSPQPRPLSLDRDQRGHLRRLINLAEQLPDDWSGMMGRSTLQEDFGALRFQLAYACYALALTHVHRLPAAPGLFREPFARLIEKLCSPDVWAYWHYVSTGNGVLNHSLGELPAEWNPVIRDNIMYSAYLQSAALLYHHIFDDARYSEPGALTLTLRPLFWGDGPKIFINDERSLSEHIYWQMVENGYLGVACEPNCIFQICNQPSILGFRLEDLIYGGSRAQEVTDGYLRAWAEFGISNEAGHFNVMVQQKERSLPSPPSPWSDFWLGALMHAWNPETVAQHYAVARDIWIRPGPADTAWVDLSQGFARAGLSSALDFGWAAVCASEVGDQAVLDGLLRYADARLHRSWDRGGLFYRRHDTIHDDEGYLAAMDPHSGNVLLGYARLNVPGGLKAIYEGQWSTARKNTPAIVSIAGRVDLEMAYYDEDARTLHWVALPVENEPAIIRFEVGRQPTAAGWELSVDGEVVCSSAGGGNPHINVLIADDTLSVGLHLSARTAIALRWY